VRMTGPQPGETTGQLLPEIFKNIVKLSIHFLVVTCATSYNDFASPRKFSLVSALLAEAQATSALQIPATTLLCLFPRALDNFTSTVYDSWITYDYENDGTPYHDQNDSGGHTSTLTRQP